MSNRRLVVIISGIEIIVILIITTFWISSLYSRNSTTIPLKKEELSFPKTAEFKHYYELPANLDQQGSPPDNSGLYHYKTNTDGLHDSRSYELEKPKNTRRILILGDSNTYGLYLDTNKNFTEKLEHLISENNPCSDKIEVLNLGVPGYDLAYTVERFFQKGVKYKPDIVVLFIREDDFYQSAEHMLVSGGQNVTKERADAIITKYGRDTLYTYQKEQLIKLAVSVDQPVVVFTLANFAQDLSKDLNQLNRTNSNVLFLNDLKALESSEQFLDGHPNEKGHTKIAAYLYELLTTRKLLC